MLIYFMMMDNQSNRDKFTEIYENYRYSMLYTAKAVLKDEFLAEDVVHDSFIKIISILDSIGDATSTKTKHLCIVITKNKAIDVLRVNATDNVLTLDDMTDIAKDTEALPLEQVINKQGYYFLLEQISKLPEQHRMVLELRYVYEYTEQEVAKILDITPENVSVKAFRARQKLK